MPGKTRGSTTIDWVDSYVAAGMSAPDLLRAMTITAARLLGVDKQRGAIRPGLAADIIATRANPLDRPDALKQVVFVMKDGAVILNR